MAGAEQVLCVSRPFAALYRAAGVANAVAIPNGVSAMAPAAARAPRAGPVRVGYIGGMEPHKGYCLVRAAFERRAYQNLRLTVVDHSRGPGAARLEMWGATQVSLIGRVAQDEVDALYAGLDVLLAPSIWPESFGLASREALAHGLWVVASDRGAMAEEIIPGENGWIVDVESVAGLERALETIDGNPAQFKTAPKFSPALRRAHEQADDLAQLYRVILEPRAN